MTFSAGTLPSSWRLVRLADVAEVITGTTPKTTESANFGGPIPFFKPTDLDAGYELVAARSTLSAVGAMRSRTFPPNTVLVTCIGATIGKSGLARIGGATNQQINAAIPKPSLMAEWLYWVIVSQTGQDWIHANASGTTLPIINKGRFLEMPIPLAPLGVQRRTVAKIEALQTRSRAAREALDAVGPLLEKFRQSVLAAAFRGDLTADWRAKNPNVEPASVLLDRIRKERRRRWEEDQLTKMKAAGKAPKDGRWKSKYVEPKPVDTDGLPELPAGWCWASLETITCGARKIRYGILKPGDDFPGGIPYVKVMHMRGDRIDVANLKRTSPEIEAGFREARLAKGDLLVSIRGTYGRVAEVTAACSGANITQDSARVAPLPGIERAFLALVLRSPVGQRYFQQVAKGMAVKGVNIADLRLLPIPVPPTPEQSAIARQGEEAVRRCAAVGDATSASSKQLNMLIQSVLARAFRGHLVANA